MDSIASVEEDAWETTVAPLIGTDKEHLISNKHLFKKVGICVHPPAKLDNDASWRLYADFLMETAIAFDSALYIVTDADEIKRYFPESVAPYTRFITTYGETFKTPVLLSKSGKDIREVELPKYPVFVIGSDNGSWSEASYISQAVKIPTPSGYPLWSAVASGIALSMHLNK